MKPKTQAGHIFTVNMLLERETKGAVRYQEVERGEPVEIGDGAKIGTLYIRKDALPTGNVPKAIQVIVQR